MQETEGVFKMMMIVVMARFPAAFYSSPACSELEHRADEETADP